MSIELVLKRRQLMTFTVPNGGSLGELGGDWGIVFVVASDLKSTIGARAVTALSQSLCVYLVLLWAVACVSCLVPADLGTEDHLGST